MKYKNYSQDIWSNIDRALVEATARGKKLYAAFDADGTLWDTDLGENFFRYQIQHNLISSLPADPWHYYQALKQSPDPRPAYLWLAQINAGQSISTVRAWAEAAIQRLSPLPIFPAQQVLIEKLRAHKVEIFIVTASVKWAVEPGAKLLGLSQDHVLGVETAIEHGMVTSRPAGHMTYREGKAQALLSVSQGQSPFLACGNTLGDSFLLRVATDISIAVGAAKESDELYLAEERLRHEATLQSWLIHKF